MDSESVVSQVQRRIELQSPEDLTYLITNVRNAAAARLNEAFPHVDGHEGEDELRNQIEALVNDVRRCLNRGGLMFVSVADNGVVVVYQQDLHARFAEPIHQWAARQRRRVPRRRADCTRHDVRTLRRPQAPARGGPHHAGGEAPRGGGIP